ncbi:arginine--tRNA ligase, chloroplastic/mitochondrial [Tanacetum coccineum]
MRGYELTLGDSTGFVIQECKEYLKWAHPTSTMAAPIEHKRRFLKWPSHSTSTVSWSLQEEISKPFETALKLIQEEINQNEMALKYGCSDLKQEHGWSYEELGGGCGPPTTLAHNGRPTVNRFGFVTLKLSGKWIAKSLHKMLKDGIDTWAPKQPIERVIVDYPSMYEEIQVDLFQRRAIRYTLMRIIEYSKVDVTIGHPATITPHIPDSMFQGENINFNFPIDSRKVKEDLLALWFGLCENKADWILYVTPLPQLEYTEMCFTAPKTPKKYAVIFELAILNWKYLFDKAKVVVGDGTRFTVLKNHRLVVWVFDIDEMFNEEGNTFVYLLNTRAKIQRITDCFRKDINELKKASKLILEEMILEKAEGWEKGEERMLRFHLLEFTENEQKNLNLLDDSNYSSQSGVP